MGDFIETLVDKALGVLLVLFVGGGVAIWILYETIMSYFH